LVHVSPGFHYSRADVLSFSIRSSKKRLEKISQNSTEKLHENTDDDSPLDENHISDEAMTQDLDEIEAAAYIKMREELDALNKANETYHKSHATMESGILFTEVGIRRYEASANDFQVCKLNHLSPRKPFLVLIHVQAQLDRLSQRAVHLEKLVNDAESRIRESETWRMQLEDEQTQILRLKEMLQPPGVRSPAGAAPKSTFIRKSSLAASKKVFEPGEARSAAMSSVPVSNMNSIEDSTLANGKVRLGATLIHGNKSRGNPSQTES
jgi:cell division protein FtsB